MLRTLIALCLVFGVVLGKTIKESTTLDSDDSSLLTNEVLELSNESNLEVKRGLGAGPFNTESEDPLKELLPRKVQLVLNVLNVIIGAKISALSIAVNVIGWVISNAFVITTGIIIALGICKFTGKCAIIDEEVVPISQLRSYATPENLNTAQRIFSIAVKKYAEEYK